MPMDKTAIIIGAGAAGLTAAFELATKTDIQPIVVEADSVVGGISKTINYRGNRIDIGGHRFFSKSDLIMRWWQDIFPMQGAPSKDDILLKRKIILSKNPLAPDPEKDDEVMLVRHRKSRIFSGNKFFPYPLSFNLETFASIGTKRMARMAVDYANARLFPLKDEKNIEDFFINRFGKELYTYFFKSYTEKLWGIPCNEIGSEWGSQRVKSVSIKKLLFHALNKLLRHSLPRSINQKNIETSLIEYFLYPKYGPGQFWEAVALKIRKNNGRLLLNHRVIGLNCRNGRVLKVEADDIASGQKISLAADFVISCMPMHDLIPAMENYAPTEVLKVAAGLKYRDLITVGLLLNKLKIRNNTSIRSIGGLIPDNWIYIQDKSLKLGRIQIYNNWSPYLVKDMNTVWLGLEYFCTKDDGFWNKTDTEIALVASGELAQIGFIDSNDILDQTVIRTPRAYPIYHGSYDNFPLIKGFLNEITNLFVIGRNGMHRYNNMDHSMLTAIMATNNIRAGIITKENIWSVNTEKSYHEQKDYPIFAVRN